MQTIVADLLRMSQITAEAKPFEPSDPARLLDNVLTSIQPALLESHAKVEVGPLPAYLLCDGSQIEQVFQNLILNALRYAEPSRPPQIGIGADDFTDRWEIHVRDNGVGIDEEHWDKIFDLFHRLHSRDNIEGTGIGLSICRKIVERHGGTVRVRSKPGHGSTFTFSISKMMTEAA